MSNTDAVEAIPRTGSVRRVRGFRQAHTPESLVTVDPASVGQAVDVIRKRILAIQRQHGGGSYLFIDNELRAFVVSDLQAIAAKWVRERFRWLVAFYAPHRADGSKTNPDGTPYMTATKDGLAEDIAQHIADLQETP